MFDLKVSQRVQDKIEKALDTVQNLLTIQAWMAQPIGGRAVMGAPMPYGPQESPTEEDQKMVEVWLEAMDPVIQREAIDMVKLEIRQMMLMGGNVKRVAEELKKGKKPRLVRKKEGRRDPLFLQMGDGVEDPIEEIHILG